MSARRVARAMRQLPAGARPRGITLAKSLTLDLPRIQTKLERWGIEAPEQTAGAGAAPRERRGRA